MGGANPPVSRHYGAREDFGDAELFESLDAPDDIDQRVPRPDLVQGDVSGRDAMHAPLGLTEEGEGPDRALPHPARQWRAFDHANQLPHMAVTVSREP